MAENYGSVRGRSKKYPVKNGIFSAQNLIFVGFVLFSFIEDCFTQFLDPVLG
jgi:hypothetical protein